MRVQDTINALLLSVMFTNTVHMRMRKGRGGKEKTEREVVVEEGSGERRGKIKE